jgi:hypothetical protein
MVDRILRHFTSILTQSPLFALFYWAVGASLLSFPSSLFWGLSMHNICGTVIMTDKPFARLLWFKGLLGCSGSGTVTVIAARGSSDACKPAP